MFYYNGDKNDLINMINNLMNPNNFIYTGHQTGRGSFQQPPQKEKICPGCGLISSELYKNGKIGCSICTDTFREELETIITHIQGKNKFSGRVPKALEKENSFNLEETQEKLAQAVQEERYEDAAIFRDVIRCHVANTSESCGEV